MLNWQTTAETGSDKFELEYSSDANNYITLTTIPAQGTSNTIKAYNYLHKNVQGTKAYYRLKIFGRDGMYKYSEVVAINRADMKYIIYPVYPNPFDQNLTVSVDAEIASVMNLYLSDISGKILSSKSVTLKKGNNKIVFEQLEKLKPGTYFLRVSNEELIKNMQLLKATN